MEWDYFISHASEDKVAVAQPLASYLSKAGFKVWYDEFSLEVGDSLLQSIDVGLGGSKFGIAILSHNFFAKKWPKSELSGLFSLEEGQKRILPVWHDITAKEVATHSPILADRLAVSSEKGLQVVAQSIVSASYPKRKKDLPLRTRPEEAYESDFKRAQNNYKKLLDEGASASDLRSFLSVNHNLIIGPYGWREEVIPGFVLPSPVDVDFVTLSPQGVTGPIHIGLSFFGSVDRLEADATLTRVASQLGPQVTAKRKPKNYHGGTLLGQFPKLEPLGPAIRELTHSENIHFNDPSCWVLSVSIFVGRRSSNVDSGLVRLPLDISEMTLDIGTYDRIADDERTFRRF
jgi:hypothetical protein